MTKLDFEQRAVASPYTVPDGFFEQMEERIALRVAAEGRPGARFLTPRLRYASAAAVAALVACSAALFQPARTAPDDYDEIAGLFRQMSADDQISMLESYQDDIFMYE